MTKDSSNPDIEIPSGSGLGAHGFTSAITTASIAGGSGRGKRAPSAVITPSSQRQNRTGFAAMELVYPGSGLPKAEWLIASRHQHDLVRPVRLFVRHHLERPHRLRERKPVRDERGDHDPAGAQELDGRPEVGVAVIRGGGNVTL